jgi:C4-dicarboxylate-specific signal transduction histidine kinase
MYVLKYTVHNKLLTVQICNDTISIKGGEKTVKFDKSMEYVSQTQTLIGQQRKRLVDQDTGELIEVDQITKRALGQKQFWKVYLIDFLQILGVLDSKQVDVLIYILENTKAADNTYIGTYRKTSDGAGVSLDTATKVMRKLQTNGFIKKVQNGVYQVSPLIMMKGSEHKKSLLLNYYADEEQTSENSKENEE